MKREALLNYLVSYNADRRAALVAAGKCQDCGKNPIDAAKRYRRSKPSVLCADCKAQRRARLARASKPPLLRAIEQAEKSRS